MLQKGAIQLVRWEEKFVQDLAHIANDPRIADNLRDAFPHPYTIQHADEWIMDNERLDPAHSFAILYEGKLVGEIGCEIGREELRVNAEIGYWIGSDYWGQGIGTTALSLFVPYLFETFQVKRVFAQVYDFNQNSVKMLQKAGFEREAILKNAYIKHGKIGDLIQLAIFAPQ